MRERDIIGKTFPKKDDLEIAKLNGFKEIEIGLRKEDTLDLKRIISLVESSGLKILGVHTPHVVEEDMDTFLKSAKFAEHFNAMLIVHSGRMPLTHSCRIMDKIIENCVFKNGHNLVFDNAHIYIGSKNFMKDARYIFENYGSKIKWIHLSDSTLVHDGLPFGKGEFNFPPLINLLDKNYKGKVVVEVMPQFQKEAKDYILKVLGK
jgi:sugar phosphate isomerase/epimerase